MLISNEIKKNRALETITFGNKQAVAMKTIMTQADFSGFDFKPLADIPKRWSQATLVQADFSGCELEGRTPCGSMTCRALSSDSMDAGSHGMANADCGRLCPALERPTGAAEEVPGRPVAPMEARSRCRCSWISAPDGVRGGLVS